MRVVYVECMNLCYQDFVLSGAFNIQNQCKGHQNHFVLSGLSGNRVCVNKAPLYLYYCIMFSNGCRLLLLHYLKCFNLTLYFLGRIYELERRLKTPPKFLFPAYEPCMWYAAKNTLDIFRGKEITE